MEYENLPLLSKLTLLHSNLLAPQDATTAVTIPRRDTPLLNPRDAARLNNNLETKIFNADTRYRDTMIYNESTNNHTNHNKQK